MAKRKHMSDEFVADDSDDGTRPAQRAKTSKTSSHFALSRAAQTDDNGDSYWEISKARRVVISEFKGMKMVNIREYYEKDGKSLPGKKGISMTLEQYSAFIRLLPQIEATLKKSGAIVPRPEYIGDDTLADDAEGDADEDEGGFIKKSNIDATSDEDEGD